MVLVHNGNTLQKEEVGISLTLPRRLTHNANRKVLGLIPGPCRGLSGWSLHVFLMSGFLWVLQFPQFKNSVRWRRAQLLQLWCTSVVHFVLWCQKAHSSSFCDSLFCLKPLKHEGRSDTQLIPVLLNLPSHANTQGPVGVGMRLCSRCAASHYVL